MFKGSIPALITPFSQGKVDEKALEKLIEWHILQGSHGLVVVGTTGESSTLTTLEHQLVIRKVVEISNNRIPIIAGAGSNNTAEAINMVNYTNEVGADGILVVTPYYNKPTQEGIIRHYQALNATTSIPILVYNIPSRSGIDIDPCTMSKLAGLSNIKGVKDATAELARVPVTRSMCGKNFIQLSGEDLTSVGFNAMGGKDVFLLQPMSLQPYVRKSPQEPRHPI